jgi:hypothetical protein
MFKFAKTMTKILPAVMLAACATQADEPITSSRDQLVLTSTDDGAVSHVSRAVDVDQDTGLRSEVNRDGLTSSQLSPRTSGCTHIRFCNAPGADEVICDTNDKTTGACTPTARVNECFSDADFVCGNWTNMTFDPPIQF